VHLNSFTPFTTVYTLDGVSVALKADAYSPSLHGVCALECMCQPAGAEWSADLSGQTVSVARCLLLSPSDYELAGRLERRAEALSDRISPQEDSDDCVHVVLGDLLQPYMAIYKDGRRMWECARCGSTQVMRELIRRVHG
jgi:hypothetical protein